MMKHLKSFNENAWIDKQVNIISMEDIEDIMTEMTDNFECLTDDFGTYYLPNLQSKYFRYNNTETWCSSFNGSGPKKVWILKIRSIFSIPDNKMMDFKKCLEQIKHRFHSILDVSFGTELTKLLVVPAYVLEFTIFNAKLSSYTNESVIKSSNPVNIISADDIEDIMTEITDNFISRHHDNLTHQGGGYGGVVADRRVQIYNSKERILNSLEKRIIKASCILTISIEKMEFFQKCLKQVEWRFHRFFNTTFQTKFEKYGRTDSTYLLLFIFDDSSII